MSEIDRFRLTHEELIALYFEAENDEGTELSSRKIADAATTKTLREVVSWLRAFLLRDSDHPTHIVHEGRGYGEWLKDAADELDAMLNTAKEQERG